MICKFAQTIKVVIVDDNKTLINQLLDHIKKHVRLSKEEESIIPHYFEHKEIKKRQYLLNSDSLVKHDFFVINGCLRTFVIDMNGNEHNLLFATENWWTGDFKGFYKQEMATQNIQALENTHVLCITKEGKDELVERIPMITLYFNKLFENAIIAHQKRIEQTLCFTAEERYLDFLKVYPNVSQRISQKHIASYLGITPEFLSMIRKKLTLP